MVHRRLTTQPFRARSPSAAWLRCRGMRGATLLACCLLLLPVFLAIPAPGPGGRPAAAVQRPAGGDPPLDPGGDLLSAVLAVEAELRRAEALAASLERRLAVLGSERRAASRRREELSRQVAAERRRLRAWLRFLHEHGWVGYTEVLLGAADFADFVRRWNLLARLTEVQVQRLQVLRSVLEEQRREETRLAALADEAAAALAEARQTAARLAALREERARRLEEARRRQAAWVESLPAVLAALRGLRALPWQELRPASVDVRFAPLRAEVVIAEADVRRVTGLDVRFAPTGLALVGRAADGNSFRLTGSLAVAGSDALRFEPAVLEVAGGRAEGDLLKDLATPEERLIRVPLPAAGLRLVGVRCEEGRLVLVLTADPAVGVGETR